MVLAIDAGLLAGKMKLDQWKSAKEIERIQERKLKALFAYASENVPYYRKTLNGISVNSLEDLAQIPILNKTDVQREPESFLSRMYDKKSLVAAHTSGSTGTPLPVYHSKAESAYGLAFECHHLLEAGASPFDLQARVTYYRSEPDLLQKLGIFRCVYLNVQDSEQNLLDKLAKIKPSVLCTNASVLYSLARLNDTRGLKMKRVLSSAEVLLPQRKAIIERSFGCPVFDRYGCMETSWIAFQCEKGSMHVHSDHMIVEIVDDEGKPVPRGKAGNLIITPLWQRAMPFIRYAIGDRASFGPGCACGRGLQTLANLEGRSDDFIVLPSGRMRSARSINLMDDVEGLSAYQIIQEEKDRFVFRFVSSGSGIDEKTKIEISRRIRHGCLDEPVKVEFEEASKIERGHSGKIRAVISKVRLA